MNRARRNGIIFTYEAVEALVDLTGRYMHEQYLPEKAIQMMDEVALAAKQEHGAGSMVTEEDGKGGVRGGKGADGGDKR